MQSVDRKTKTLQKMATENSYKLFKNAVANIPAYTRFLKKNKFDPDLVKSPEDLEIVPFTSKKDYLWQYDKKHLTWPDGPETQLIYCTSSGSTGQPYYFPRTDKLDEKASYMAEEFLVNNNAKDNSTLVITGLGMGVWIGGIMTHNAFHIAAKRLGVKVALLPAGYNRVEILKALKLLSPNFDQTILCGYPPFVKELIDEAKKEDINLKKIHLRLVFAAEAFSETFRDFVCKNASVKDPIIQTMNIYGTADMGAMAHETPLSVSIRRAAVKKKEIFNDIFGQIQKTPTLAQFNPDFIEFEAVGTHLAITGDSTIPLIRYSLGDNGGVISYSEMAEILAYHGLNIDKMQSKSKAKYIKNRPFVFVYERADLSASLHGINIYPEYIKEGLYHKKAQNYVTNKFTMATRYDQKQNQYLEINVELQKSIEPDPKIAKKLLNPVIQSLQSKSSEFREISKSYKPEKLVTIHLWPHGDNQYFSPGTKQKWVEKA